MTPTPPAHDPAGSTDEITTVHLVALDRDHPGFRDLAYRKRRDAIAELGLSHRPGGPVPDVAYAPEEHVVWRTVWEHLAPLHDSLACDAYRSSAAALRLDRRRIPQLAEVNRELARTTGFQLSPVAGLVDASVFLAHLGRRIFLSTQYVRHPSRPLYTPEPDVIHELVGHAVTLVDPTLAAMNERFARALERGADVERLTRVYWYTLEFGAVEEAGTLKVYGAGLLSSFGELGRFATEAELRPFDLERMAATPFDPTNYQETVFVAPGLERAFAELGAWLDAQPPR